MAIICSSAFSDKDQQLARLMARNQLTEEEAEQRIGSQMSLDSKRSMVTNPICLIDNSNAVSETKRRVVELKKYLDRSWRPEVLRVVLGSCLCLLLYSLL